ncbi:MAG: hypothetical protein KatS3mg111_0043 [Pirellulaceae bacterium]|nr:MAG: hypothetical protein KatS3mg111_0043 [Pirellulaceae bacterium]
MSNLPKYYDPETLARIQPLALRARMLVEGVMAGLHHSSLRGQSIEFAQHREYVAGDDLRQVDWKVFAKSDRFYVKQYEDETNLICFPLVDISESMDFRGDNAPLTKLEYAQLIACAIAFVVTSQQDSSGLITFDHRVRTWLPPSSGTDIMDDLVRVFETTVAEGPTDLNNSLLEVLQGLRRSSLLVLVTDGLSGDEQWIEALKMVRLAGHDLIVIQVLDQDEITFPFDMRTRFVGLEGTPTVETDPALIAAAYRRAMAEELQRLERACSQAGADYFRATTNQSLAVFLPNLLATRLVRGKRR